MMRLGISTFAFMWGIGVSGYPPPPHPLSAEDLLQKALELGVKVVQYADNLPLSALTAERRAALLAQARAHGISIEIGTRGIHPDHMRDQLRLAQECGAPFVRVVVDTREHHPTPHEVAALLGDVLPDYERADVKIAIENHDRFKVRTLASIVETLNTPYVGICLDTVNSFGSLEGPEVVVDTLGPHVINLHVKEFVIRRADHSMGFTITGVPAGQGMLDLPWLIDKLGQFGRVPNAILEQWPAPEADSAATAAKESVWAAESIRYLRTLIPD